MILFVFEGQEREVDIFNALRQLYFGDEEVIVEFTYNTGFHTLYKELKKNDMSLFRVLQEASKKRDIDKLGGYKEDDFSEVFLVFDYDFHNKDVTLEQWNQNLKEMLDYFDDETKNGKMYVNYPMVESIRYTKELPDKDYYKYTVKRDECLKIKGNPTSGFKYKAAEFSAYLGLDFIQITESKTPEERDTVRKNWDYLKRQNVAKAHYLCDGANTFPRKKTLFPQAAVFDAQCKKYVNTDECRVAILNSFPIFLYEYFK